MTKNPWLCTHKWILDSQNKARCCRCGWVKQFPVEKHIIGRSYIEELLRDFRYDPDYFQNGSLHEMSMSIQE